MDEQQLQQAFIQFLAEKTGAKNQLELEAVIQLLGEDGLKQAYLEFIQTMQQQLALKAKFGAKLNYIKGLRGQCPEGYEVGYFKAGGHICKKCMKKQAMQDGGNVTKDPIDEFKCGRKMKKKELGGLVDYDKCGKKMKKKAEGGDINYDKCGGKTKKKSKKQEGGTFDPKTYSKATLAKCGAKLREVCKDINYFKCGSKILKNQKGYPLVEEDSKGKLKTTYYKDEATRDSIVVNKYGDDGISNTRPGTYKTKKGKYTWVPDRTKPPYNKMKSKNKYK